MLVQFLVLTKQPTKAVQAISDAESALPASLAPLALAQCCAQLGRFYEGIDETEKTRWFARTKGWYEKAIAAHPDDMLVARRLTEFYVQTKQMDEVEAQLEAILKAGSNAKNAEIKAWARRTLSLALASTNDPQRLSRALSILDPVAAGKSGAKALEDPDDLRALAQVLEAQRAPEHRKRAIEIMELLVEKNLANTDDRFFLTRLEEASGQWPKALRIYHDLNVRTKNPRDLESLNRRSVFLTEFTRALLRNYKPGQDQDLSEAQDLVDELARRQPECARHAQSSSGRLPGAQQT